MLLTRKGSVPGIADAEPDTVPSAAETETILEEDPNYLHSDTDTSSEVGSMSKLKAQDNQHKLKKSLITRKLFSYFICFLIGLVGSFTKLEQKATDPEANFPAETTVHREPLITNLTFLVDNKMESLDILREAVVPPPLIIIVTPTYVRPFQAMYLHRMANCIAGIRKPVLWLVVEMTKQSTETAKILRQSGLTYRHLVADKNMTDIKDRGVHQRNAAIEHMEEHRLDGIVYFADDDNVYSHELFEEIRKIKRFGVWPVAFLQVGKSKPIIEGPVCEGSKVIGWHTNEKSKRLRRFHVDMSGFAFNSTILWDPDRWNRPTTTPIRQLDTVKEGFQETTFIEQLVADESQMEGLADGCSKALAFHLHLEGFRSSPFPHWSVRNKLPVTNSLLSHEV